MERSRVQRRTAGQTAPISAPPRKGEGQPAEAAPASPSLMTTAGLLTLQRAAGNRAVSAAIALQRDRSRQETPPSRPPVLPPRRTVQRKLEFAQHYAVAPKAATAAVKADYEGYAAYQQKFENKLGLGLYNSPQAHEGADAMLGLMSRAMTAAGFSEGQTKKAFASKGSKGNVDLGAVLAKDVTKAMKSGNLREKMGMVYQARSDIATAIDTLTKQGSDLIGDEMSSADMQEALKATAAKNQHVSYAILKRRQSVTSFKRTGATKMEGVIKPQVLDAEGIGLSKREKAAVEHAGAKKLFAGREFYVVDPGARKAELDKLRAVVAGLSGSTDMYFHIAKHLKMDSATRKKFRLAALGQMIVNQDHSYHEIMHVAKTQGELTDYPDELPIGYTTLAPLSTDQILTLTGLPDFPGDAQVRDVGAMSTAADITADAAVGKKSKTYPAVLAYITAYHTDPSAEKLEVIVDAIDGFLKKKKPGLLAKSSTKKKYDDRRVALEKVRKQATQLQAQWKALSKVPRKDLAAFAQQSMAGGDKADIDRMTRLIAQEAAPSTDWQSKDFRSSDTDAGLDISAVQVSVAQQKDIMQITDERRLARAMGDKTDDPKAVPINANLKTDLEEFVAGNKLVVDVVTNDIQPQKLTIKQRLDPVLNKRNQEIAAIQDPSHYSKQDEEDFTTNIDKSAFDILSKPEPTDPVGKLLKKMENQPTPAELAAINAYAQPGFYVIMNKVLNKAANKKFMASREGKAWWASVPAEVKQLTSLAVSAVRKLEPYKGGNVYRGQPGPGADKVKQMLKRPKPEREQYWTEQYGGNWPFYQFVSTAKRPYASYAVKEDNYLALHIENPKTGVDISAFSNTLEEREVLFPPGTTFRVTKVEDKFKTATEPNNRYSDAVLHKSTEPGRVKITMEEV